MKNVLQIDVRDTVTTLTLNRPERRNALNLELLRALSAAIAAAAADERQQILVLRGAGAVFCAGLDLEEARDAALAESSAEELARALQLLADSRLVTIATVHGAAIAGGAGLMSACDFALATRATQFGFPEVRRGLVPALILTFLRRQLRERDVRELLLLADPFDAERAVTLGLLNRVVADPSALEQELAALIEKLRLAAPGAVTATKRLLADLTPRSIEEDLARARQTHLAARGSAEAREGVAAFLEKRPPRWADRGSS